MVAGGAPPHLPGQPQLLCDPPHLDIMCLERQIPGHRHQRHKGDLDTSGSEILNNINYQQEFQGGLTRGEITLEQEVHKFLKDLPPTKFFFLYFVGHNLDYRSLKILAQRITDIVSRHKNFYHLEPIILFHLETPTSKLRHISEESPVQAGLPALHDVSPHLQQPVIRHVKITIEVHFVSG